MENYLIAFLVLLGIALVVFLIRKIGLPAIMEAIADILEAIF